MIWNGTIGRLKCGYNRIKVIKFLKGPKMVRFQISTMEYIKGVMAEFF